MCMFTIEMVQQSKCNTDVGDEAEQQQDIEKTTNLSCEADKDKLQHETTIWWIWNKPLIYWQTVLQYIRLHITLLHIQAGSQ